MKNKLTYELIRDIDEFNEFLNILPECKENEQYYLALFARKKYFDDLPSDKAQLKRNTSTKDRLLSKIRQFELPFGHYTYGTDNLPIPEESMAVYISITPRDLKQASGILVKELVNQFVNGNEYFKNPKSLAMSCIQKSKSESYFIDFDYDYKDDNFIEKLKNELKKYLNDDSYYIIETRGGYHVLVMPHKIEKQYMKNWYNNLRSIENFDQAGDNLIPIPGTIQGGFVVRIIK